MHRYMLTHSCTQWNRHPCIILAITALHCLMCVLWRIHTCKLGHSAFYAPAFSIVSWQDHANFLSAFLRFFFSFLFYLRKGSGFTFTFFRPFSRRFQSFKSILQVNLHTISPAVVMLQVIIFIYNSSNNLQSGSMSLYMWYCRILSSRFQNSHVELRESKVFVTLIHFYFGV